MMLIALKPRPIMVSNIDELDSKELKKYKDKLGLTDKEVLYHSVHSTIIAHIVNDVIIAFLIFDIDRKNKNLNLARFRIVQEDISNSKLVNFINYAVRGIMVKRGYTVSTLKVSDNHDLVHSLLKEGEFGNLRNDDNTYTFSIEIK
jgi:hypothetical protein